jgi:spermidine synthase
VIAGDALAYLRKTKEKFDVIIMDINDPLEGGPGVLLYTKDFYRMLLRRLSPGGIIVTQAGPASYGVAGLHSAICNTMRKGTGTVFPYKVNMVSFASDWGFAMSGPGAKPLALTAAEIDRRIKRRLSRPLRSYDGEAHTGMFRLPKWLREKIENEKRSITRNRHVYLEA